MAILIVLIIGSGVYAILYSNRKETPRSEGDEIAPRVQVIRIERTPVARQWDGYGSARAMESSDVPSRVTATVRSIPETVLEGAFVNQGDLLVQLDDSDFARQAEVTEHSIEDLTAQLARLVIDEQSWIERRTLAEERTALARAEYERVRTARERGGAKDREVDLAREKLVAAMNDQITVETECEKIAPQRTGLEAQRAALNAQLRLMNLSIARCRIESPLEGVLQAVDVEVGENLNPGQRVARVVSLKHIEAPLRMSSSARSTIRLGDAVTIRSTGVDDLSWTSTITRIAPEDDEMNRTMTIFVEIEQDPTAPGLLTPGRFVRAVVETEIERPRWIVPRRAIREDRVLMVEDNRIVSRTIHPDFRIEAELPQYGIDDRQWVVVRDELPEGALLVVNPTQRLVDGLQVQVVEMNPMRAADDAGETAP
jgi:multidrug efflux pump subunit AcrA (membrane-fusion protein)